MTFGERLKAWRVYKGLSQGELADRLDKSQGHVSQLEAQRTAHPKTERAVADAMDITLGEFQGMPPLERPRLEDALRKDLDFDGQTMTEAEKVAVAATLRAIRSGK